MKQARTAVFHLQTVCLAVCLGVVPYTADAGEALLKPEPNRKVIVFDNEYLDRRFGRERAGVAQENQNNVPAPSMQGVYAFGPQIVDIPSPRRAVDVMPNSSFLRGVTRATPARRAAALRLAETGRTLLKSGEPRKAIHYFEKALGMDASPFVHFYLARAHLDLSDYTSARRFLEVAESGLFGQADWLPELATLRETLSGSQTQSGIQPRNIASNVGK
ncbi:MAG TPA: hypothetical protein VJQ55_15325 [Candidatus Binatia bacterium]|nr:hypothetical protein [Candidatus Binatia bacterium]